MKIGVIKDPKQGESRVGMTPENAERLVQAGNEVLVEKDAGLGSGFPNDLYEQAGAKIVDTQTAWNVGLVVKVKEPMKEEFIYFKKDLIIWGFLHLAASKEVVDAMVDAKVTAISGETISIDGVLELLKPMSAIAGRRAVNLGQYYLEKQHGGEGILLPGIEGIDPGTVVILGGGNAAENAADMALGLNCKVYILELNEQRIQYLEYRYKEKNIKIIRSTTENLEKYIQLADVFISTILIPGAKPPKIVKEYMVKTMKNGSVIIDIAIDQGGTVETIEAPTSHQNPIFEKYGVIHYAVPNMPGATPRTSTIALAQGNISYLLAIAENGLEAAISSDKELASGISIYKGYITQQGISDSFGYDYHELEVLAHG